MASFVCPPSPQRRARRILSPAHHRRFNTQFQIDSNTNRSKCCMILGIIVGFQLLHLATVKFWNSDQTDGFLSYDARRGPTRTDITTAFVYPTIFNQTRDNVAASSKFDPSKVFSRDEWQHVIITLFPNDESYNRRRILLAWPTIPTSLKGSDDRALDAVRFLTLLGYKVDLVHWTDYSVESLSVYDDTKDREMLIKAGIQRILGPFDLRSFSKVVPSSYFQTHDNQEEGAYMAMLLWLWPDTCYLSALMDIVQHVKRSDGIIKVISAIDDVGIASRYFIGACENPERSQEEIQQFVLDSRPLNPKMGDADGKEGNTNIRKITSSFQKTDFNRDAFRYGTALLHQELYLYRMSDFLLGINKETTDFLSRVRDF